MAAAGWHGDYGQLRPAEESPGSTKPRCRVTPGEGDLRESATESKPPRLQMRLVMAVAALCE